MGYTSPPLAIIEPWGPMTGKIRPSPMFAFSQSTMYWIVLALKPGSAQTQIGFGRSHRTGVKSGPAPARYSITWLCPPEFPPQSGGFAVPWAGQPSGKFRTPQVLPEFGSSLSNPKAQSALADPMGVARHAFVEALVNLKGTGFATPMA